MRTILSEKNIVIILFVMVLITFSLAQEDSRKMEKIQSIQNAGAVSEILTPKPENKLSKNADSFYPVFPVK